MGRTHHGTSELGAFSELDQSDAFYNADPDNRERDRNGIADCKTDPTYFIRARFKKFRSALAVERVIETLNSRTRFKNMIERYRAILPLDISSAATSLLQTMNCEATTRQMNEHDFRVRRLQVERAAFERMLRSLGHQQLASAVPGQPPSTPRT